MLVENYRPEVKERLGIGYETLAALNPRLVYASIPGYGQDGPYRLRPGFDQIAQGMGGLMSITGLPGQGPVRVGIPIADLCAGIFCAYGITVALIEREKSGQGQWVKSSLLQAQLFMLDFQAARWLMKGEVAKQAGNNHPTSIPTGVYKTRDGYFNIAVSGHKIWTRFCEAIDASELLTHPDYTTAAQRSDNRDALHAELERRLQAQDTAHWIELLNQAGVPCGPIYSIDQAFADPQVQHLGIAQKVGDVAYLGQPVTLSRTPSQVISHPPALGGTHHRGAARSRLRKRRDSAIAPSGNRLTSSQGNTDAKRQDDCQEGRRRRLDDPEQPGTPQRDLARDVGRGARDHGRFRR